MQYRAASYANDVWDAYWYERNLQGDVVAVYNSAGTKLISYTYDAWGNCTATSTTNTVVANNPFRYRGYYYDVDLGLYYLGTRYYDANTGRFISPDGVMSDVGGSIQGYNLYSYCFNNPVMHTDYTGNWPKWMKKVGKAVANFVDAVVNSIEIELGVGYGVGFEASNNVTADLSRDTYVRFDDGVFVTGNVITAELSLFDSKIGVGDSFDHVVEIDGVRVSESGNAFDGPFDMINYPDVVRGNQLSILFYTINNEGEELISISGSAHLGGGGHFSLGFNVTEFMRRLFD